jgi:hypothetical protein
VITNNSGKIITEYYIADQANNFIFQPYVKGGDFQEFRPGDTRTIKLPAGAFMDDYNLMFTTGNSKYDVHQRNTVDANIGGNIEIKPSKRSDLSVHNDSGKKVEFMYIADELGDYGGSFFDPRTPLNNAEGLVFKVPEGIKTIFLVDEKDTYYVRYVKVEYSYWWKSFYKSEIKLKDTNSGVEFTFHNNTDNSICDVYIYRYDDNNKNILGDKPKGLREFLGFAFGNRLVQAGEKRVFKLEPGRYYMEAWNCGLFGDKKIVEKRTSVQVRGTKHSWTIGMPCNTVGVIKNGGKEYPLIKKTNPQVESSTNAVWEDYYATFEPVSGSISAVICDQGRKREVSAGTNIIDPDGYVYDAAQGIEVVIEGASVTCDMYDEDYQTWERWPAELYNSQLSPQITGPDGYYAFFVPPGLYRVRAYAPGYDLHTSPDIRVIDEIVHYNIPMTRGGKIYLPFVVR